MNSDMSAKKECSAMSDKKYLTKKKGKGIKAKDDILAHHRGLLYPARVLKIQEKGNKISYFVHYLGWKQRWDEWVSEGRVFKCNDANMRKKELLLEEAKKNKNKRKSKYLINKNKKLKAASTSKNSKKKRQKEVDDTIISESGRASKKTIKIKIPGLLKKQLATDWEQITKKNALLPLPRDPSVSQILDYYLSAPRRDKNPEITKKVIAALKQYFNSCLEYMLLYKHEKQQFVAWMKKKKDTQELSDIYGAEHLTRLFVKLPGLLMYTRAEPAETSLWQQKLSIFVRWLSWKKNYFLNEYEKLDVDCNEKVNNIVNSDNLSTNKQQ